MIAAGFVLLAAAALIGWCAGIIGERRQRWLSAAAWVLNIGAAVAFVVAGAQGLSGRGSGWIDLGMLGGLGPARLVVDALSGLFLVITFSVAVPVLSAAAASANPARPRLPAAVAVALAAVAVIMTADNFFVLLFGWETLTVAFYLLAGYDRDRPGRARRVGGHRDLRARQRRRATDRRAAAGRADPHLRVHRRRHRPAQRRGAGRLCAAAVRVRHQSRPGSRPHLDAARVR